MKLTDFLRLKPFILFLVLFIASTSNAVSIFDVEQRDPCPVPTITPDPSLYDNFYAPSYISTKVDQDGKSRYVIGALRWDDESYFHYFVTARTADTNQRLGFEMETHFYNYDDAEALGRGPAYALYLVCEPSRVFTNSCFGAPGTWFRCDLPNCYRDTQAASATNSKLEYSQPNIAFGSSDAYYLSAGITYTYGSRVINGRGDRSLVKLNFQVTRPITRLLIPQTLNMYACRIPGAPNDGDVELIPFQKTKGSEIFAPICVKVDYKNKGVTRLLTYCPS